MSADQMFTITNTLAVVGWVLLAVLPGRKWVTDILTGKALPAFFAVLYIGIVITTFFGAE